MFRSMYGARMSRTNAIILLVATFCLGTAGVLALLDAPAAGALYVLTLVCLASLLVRVIANR